jgi:hypothetical protein
MQKNSGKDEDITPPQTPPISLVDSCSTQPDMPNLNEEATQDMFHIPLKDTAPKTQTLAKVIDYQQTIIDLASRVAELEKWKKTQEILDAVDAKYIDKHESWLKSIWAWKCEGQREGKLYISSKSPDSYRSTLDRSSGPSGYSYKNNAAPPSGRSDRYDPYRRPY